MPFQNINEALTYVLNAPLGNADPDVVGQPGPPWLWIWVDKHGSTVEVKGYKNVEPGVMSFWRYTGGIMIDLVKIMLAGHKAQGQKDGDGVEGQDIFSVISGDWDTAYNRMNTAISGAPDAIFWPKSTYELADLMNGVAAFSQTRFGDLYDQVRAVQRDEGSFRGSAMQAWDLMVRNTAAKFDPVPATLRTVAFHLRELADKQQLFVDRLQDGLRRMGSYNGIDWSDPSNLVVWLFDRASMTRTQPSDSNTTGGSSELNADHDLGRTGGGNGETYGDDPMPTIVLGFAELGVSIDVFAANQADWLNLSNAMRAYWARNVKAFFEEAVVAANDLEQKLNYVNQIMKLDRAAPDMPLPPPDKEDDSTNDDEGNDGLNLDDINELLKNGGAGGGGNLGGGGGGNGTGGLNADDFNNLFKNAGGGGGGGGLDLGGGGDDLDLGGGGGGLDLGGGGDDLDLGGGGGGLDLGGDPSSLGGPSGLGDNLLTAGGPSGLGGAPSGLGGAPSGLGGSLLSTGGPSSLGGPSGLGDLGSSSLDPNTPLTDAQRQALADAGMPASDGTATIGGLTPSQLGVLGSQGLLPTTGIAGGTGGPKSLLGTSSPTTLGDLSPDQLAELKSKNLLDAVPLTDVQRNALAAAGMPVGADDNDLGDLTRRQLNALDNAGLLNETPLSLGQQLALDDPGSGALTDYNQSLKDRLADGRFHTVPLNGGTGPSAFEFAKGGTGMTSGGLQNQVPDAIRNAAAIANAPATLTTGDPNVTAAGMGGMGSMGQMPYLPAMGGMGGGQGGQQKNDRERSTWLVEDEEVWGANPDCAPAVVGRGQKPGEPGSIGTPGAPAEPPRPVRRPRRTQREKG